MDELYRRYLKSHSKPAFSREDLDKWYDGYHMEDGYSMYNPNSVVRALTRNKLNNYWTKAGEYVELKDYVLNDIDGVREAVMLLAAGEPVEADISEYASTAAELKFRDEILFVMAVYGYLNYYNGYALRFQGKIGEQPKTAGRIILVGIGYYRKDKVHRCRIEMLEPGLPA